MSCLPISPFQWNGSKWAKCDVSEDHKTTNKPDAAAGALKLATFNILCETFPWFIRLAISSDDRFTALLTELERINADVVGLNEVTPHALQIILSSPFIRAHYFVSENEALANRSINRSHGCLLLSKQPFTALYIAPVQPRHAVVGLFHPPAAVQPLAVCSLHTPAYQTERNAKERALQIREVLKLVRPLSSQVVIMGDLNMHDPSEDAFILQNNLLDLWTETHVGEPEEKGYTFDPTQNSMIPRYIPGESRRMRLDRILLSRGSNWRPSAPVWIWANTPVDPSRELFLSDHFGLAVTISPSSSAFDGSEAAAEVVKRNAATVWRAYSPYSFRFAVALVKHTVWLSGRAFSVANPTQKAAVLTVVGAALAWSTSRFLAAAE